MINHVVMMKLKEGTQNADIEWLEGALDDLPNKIMEIHGYEFGRDIIRSPRSYDFALVALFANPESLERYQKHPDHLVVVDKLKTICEDIITVDFTGTDASSFKEKTPDMGIPDW
jgi:hypothetical protein